MDYTLMYTSQAKKDAKKLEQSNLREKAIELLSIIKRNPYQNPPPYEKLQGELKECYSRRVNSQHRIVYEIHKTESVIKILRMWTHYE